MNPIATYTIPMFTYPTKICFSLCLFLFFGQAKGQVQPEVNPYKFQGKVKTMTIATRDYGNTPNLSTKILSFDLYGRKILEKEPNSGSQEYLYPNTKATEPVLTHYKSAKYNDQSYQLYEFDPQQRLVFSATIENGKVQSQQENTFQPGKEEQASYTSNHEIDSRTRSIAIDLSKKKLPAAFLPFNWDRQLSYGFDQKQTSFSNSPSEHIQRFKFVEQGKPGNWIIISYGATGTDNAGRGYWTRYINHKQTEDRYISNFTDLSGFGHLYQYDAKGRMTTDTYGDFDKIPKGTFKQKNVYSYDQYGQLIKSVNMADGKQAAPIIYNYQYDKNGNWTSCSQKFYDGSGYSTIRTITYYEPNQDALTNGLRTEQYTSLLKQAKQGLVISEKKYSDYLSAKEKISKTPQKNINYRNLKSGNWKDFLPENNTLDSMCTGDLNKDGSADVVLVYQPKKLLQHQKNTKRTLRILFKQADGQYTLAAESEHATFPEDTNDTFFEGIGIKNGILLVQHEYLRGNSTYKYRYQQGGFYLIGASRSNFDPTYTYEIDYNLSTGQYVITYTNTGDDPNQQKSYQKKGVQKVNPLPNIETFEPHAMKVGDNYL